MWWRPSTYTKVTKMSPVDGVDDELGVFLLPFSRLFPWALTSLCQPAQSAVASKIYHFLSLISFKDYEDKEQYKAECWRGNEQFGGKHGGDSAMRILSFISV
jgi:hypothetical protein